MYHERSSAITCDQQPKLPQELLGDLTLLWRAGQSQESTQALLTLKELSKGQGKYIIRSKQTTNQKQTQFNASTPLSLKVDRPHYSHPFSSAFPSLCLLKQSSDLLHPRNTKEPLQMPFIFCIASVR